MGRSSLVFMLAVRGLVHDILGIVGGVSFLSGLVCLVLALGGKGFPMLVFGAIGLAIWHGTGLLRWSYDTAILRRTPAGERIHLL